MFMLHKRFSLLLLLALLAGSRSASAQKDIHRENIEWANFWMENVDRDDRPHVLFIGNSITQRYAPIVAETLKDKAYFSRLTTSKSLGDPLYLQEVEMALSHNRYHVIHFNNGLHGRAYTEDEYIRDFAKLYRLIRKYAPDATLIWATITPVRDAGRLDRFEPFNERVAERNRRVLRYLEDKGVLVNDLNAILADRPDLYDPGDGVHPNSQGTRMLAEQVTDIIRPLLEQ
ncbi:SGNH/GDSL hydrolase family protein [uncultured Rikenella sp.]|uniref:SGNH/GDSL hydrolase family protein n=1 Tax=uncultured Rikenella sp. TaxID=368003 RepID=UPI0025CE7EE2|nr:SGNH/GDSL hydrolase family protein [uncultured Rikenella sp.]